MTHNHGNMAILTWIENDETIPAQENDDEEYPFYWRTLGDASDADNPSDGDDEIVDSTILRSRMKGFAKSIDRYFFGGQLNQHCVYYLRDDLVDENGDMLEGQTERVNLGLGFWTIEIRLGVSLLNSKKEFIETCLHEMSHAWLAIGQTNCVEEACRVNAGRTGHGKDWLELSRAVEKRAEKIHGEYIDLGRADGALEELTTLSHDEGFVERRNAMLKAQFSPREWEELQQRLAEHQNGE